MYNFFFIFVITIIVTRVILYFYPIPAPTIKRFRIHHYMYGVTGIIMGFLINSMVIYAVGFGLFIDELTYILIGGGEHIKIIILKHL